MDSSHPVVSSPQPEPGLREKVAPFLDNEIFPAQPAPTYGLRHHVLSPLEVLAQSISTIAPSTSPTLTVPLVFALAGNGTWLAYLIAMAAMVLMSLTIAVFARDSASPGSLYVYTRDTLSPPFAAVGAWALFFAYITTASSVIGGFVNSCYLLAPSLLAHLNPHIAATLLTVFAAIAAAFIACRDVKISARIMLWVEAVSVLLIAIVVACTLAHRGLHMDHAQLHLTGVSASGVRLGVMLAIFSFVGFESATTLGTEARDPLRTIPRAVIRSAAFAGLFFILCSYAEVAAFHTSPVALGDSTGPFRFLSAQAGVAMLGPVIDGGVLVSMFAATLACIIAAARVLLLMAHHGLAHKRLTETHARNETPVLASLITAFLAAAPAAALAARGVSGADIYGWMGTLAVFGFLTAYALVAIAMPVHLARRARRTTPYVLLSIAATLAALAAFAGTLYPVPPSPYRYLPWVYAGYLVAGMGWYFFIRLRLSQPRQPH